MSIPLTQSFSNPVNGSSRQSFYGLVDEYRRTAVTDAEVHDNHAGGLNENTGNCAVYTDPFVFERLQFFYTNSTVTSYC